MLIGCQGGTPEHASFFRFREEFFRETVTRTPSLSASASLADARSTIEA